MNNNNNKNSLQQAFIAGAASSSAATTDPNQQQQQQQQMYNFAAEDDYQSYGMIMANISNNTNYHHQFDSFSSSSLLHQLSGPVASLEWLESLPSLGTLPSHSASMHAQLQLFRHLHSSQHVAPHQHARLSAQLARSSLKNVNVNVNNNNGVSASISIDDIVMADGQIANSSVVSVSGASRPLSTLSNSSQSGVASSSSSSSKKVIPIVDPNTRLQLSKLGGNTLINNSAFQQQQQQQGNCTNIYADHQKWAQQVEPNRWSILDLGGMAVHSLNSCAGFFRHYSHLTCLYLSHNQLYSIPSSIELLESLIVLDLSFNKIRSLPNELGNLRQLKELWLFENMIETLPWQFAFLRSLEFIGLEGNPIMKFNPYSSNSYPPPLPLDMKPALVELLRGMQYEHPLAEVLSKEGPLGMVNWLRDQMPIDILVPFPIPQRRWIFSGTSSTLPADKLDKDSFVIMSYNILCEKYATQQQYWHTPAWSLQWSHRREKILNEIFDLSADIVCLQEMDWGQYEEWFYPNLCGSGIYNGESVSLAAEMQHVPNASLKKQLNDPRLPRYHSLFQPKSRYRTMTKKGPGGGVDGCAIFWNPRKFARVGSPLVIEFTQLAFARQDFEKNDTLFERFCSKDNIALGVVLEDASGRRVLVVNVHIHWDPQQTDVKLVQTILLMEEIEKFIKKFNMEMHGNKKSAYEKLPLLLCGDFNSLPKSLVYDFLTRNGGIVNVGAHPDLTECFSDFCNSLPKTSSLENLNDSNGDGSLDIERTTTDSSDTRASIKRWKNWKESGYGEFSKSATLKHSFSGSLKSVYTEIEGVKIEDQNIYVPPAHVSSSAASLGQGGRVPPSHPVPALPFTNHTLNFTGVIDYIFFTGNDFEVNGVLGGYFLHDDIGRELYKWLLNVNRSSPLFHNHQTDALSLGQTLNAPNSTLPRQSRKVFLPSQSSHDIFTSSLFIRDANPMQITQGRIPTERLWSLKSSRTIGFPNPVFPSDHIPVAAEIRWSSSSSK